MRSGGNGADGHDEAAHALLPPPRELPLDPGEQLWHTASFPAVTDGPERRRKVTTGLAVLGVSTLGLCGFAGVKVAAMAGVTPPSPPRYVISEQAQQQLDEAQHRDQLPAPPAVDPQPPQPVAVTAPAPGRHRAADPSRTKSRDKDDSRDGDDKPSKAKHRKKSDEDDDD
jgi:hypothetical protein